MSLPRHNPPGLVDDFNESSREKWSAIISHFMTRNSPPPQFYDATRTTEEGEAATRHIDWEAFPRNIMINHDGNSRFAAADASRSVQDEYLEWSVKRNQEGKITRIVFCNEGPEYWAALGRDQPDDLVALVQKLHPDITVNRSALFHDGVYCPNNIYNNSTTTGTILHLIQRNNTLSAQVQLARDATVIRRNAQGLVTDQGTLIRCSRFGDPGRFSDPTIGAQINELARAGLMLTVKDPVGLYIGPVNLSAVTVPDEFGGHAVDVEDFWHWERGVEPYYMRARFEVPEGKGFVVGDLLVSGEKLQWGSQLAHHIRVGLYGRGWGEGHAAEAQPCREPPQRAFNADPSPCERYPEN